MTKLHTILDIGTIKFFYLIPWTTNYGIAVGWCFIVSQFCITGVEEKIQRFKSRFKVLNPLLPSK